MMAPETIDPPTFLTMPPEVLLYIFSFLDLPDLAQLSTISPRLRNLASDKALHRLRVLVVAPSRIRHFLFAQGGSLRPTVGDLVQRGVMRGLGMERRWRHGLYFSSPQSVKQYWTSQRLDRAYVCHSISSLLGSRPTDPLKVQSTARVVLPDVESCSPRISHTLLPVVHQLKWSLQRDRLAKIHRDKQLNNSPTGWFEGNARSFYVEGERVRLALCPGVRRLKSFYESLSK
ncbi:hypothetical protein JB92DRAFT_2917714 [Gautieria morchelliformis]|nr:hypothetical protein JB92DRAFT_2917714 [Gautieria morchelliformis]